MSRPLYSTGVNEDGRRFSLEKLWRGHRPVEEAHVELMREILRESEDQGERDRAKSWLREYEEKSSG